MSCELVEDPCYLLSGLVVAQSIYVEHLDRWSLFRLTPGEQFKKNNINLKYSPYVFIMSINTKSNVQGQNINKELTIFFCLSIFFGQNHLILNTVETTDTGGIEIKFV